MVSTLTSDLEYVASDNELGGHGSVARVVGPDVNLAYLSKQTLTHQLKSRILPLSSAAFATNLVTQPLLASTPNDAASATTSDTSRRAVPFVNNGAGTAETEATCGTTAHHARARPNSSGPSRTRTTTADVMPLRTLCVPPSGSSRITSTANDRTAPHRKLRCLQVFSRTPTAALMSSKRWGSRMALQQCKLWSTCLERR